jgi:hypothetical protein
VFPTITWPTLQILGDNQIHPALTNAAYRRPPVVTPEAMRLKVLLHNAFPLTLLVECTYSNRALFLGDGVFVEVCG